MFQNQLFYKYFFESFDFFQLNSLFSGHKGSLKKTKQKQEIMAKRKNKHIHLLCTVQTWTYF